MKRKNIISVISVLFSLGCAFWLFLNWNPETLLKQEQQPVTMNDIEQGSREDFTGLPAGGDIPRLTGEVDFSEILYELDYVTAEPVGIVSTSVYSLKPWMGHYNTHTYKGRTRTGSRRAEVSMSGFDIWDSYNQYYLVELPDHTFILAQIPQTEADAIAMGKNITLSIGQKIGMTDTARSYLADICKEYGVSMDGVFYALIINGRRNTIPSYFCCVLELPSCFGSHCPWGWLFWEIIFLKTSVEGKSQSNE